MYSIKILITGLLIGHCGSLLSCPSFLYADEIGKFTVGKNRKNLRLFSYNSQSRGWKSIPIQVDPVDDDGKLMFFDENPNSIDGIFGKFDRMAFHVDDFGEKYLQNQVFPCSSNEAIELSPLFGEKKYGYLAVCDDQESPKLNSIHPIHHESSSRTVVSKIYKYEYEESNHFMFRRISMAFNNRDDHNILISEFADQLIRGDFKNFFSMDFDADDIDAYIINERTGPIGLLGRLTFYLKILFLKIDLRLMPEVNFFPHSIFMPMIMQLPIDARDYLHPGSGLYYTWKPGRHVHWDMDNAKMPRVDAKKIIKGSKALAQLGLAYCEDEECQYSFSGDTGLRKFNLQFVLARDLVEQGFFPMLIDNNLKLQDELGWAMSHYSDAGRVGVYFEASGLPEGGHGWQFWIRLQKTDEDLSSYCPEPLRIGRKISL